MKRDRNMIEIKVVNNGRLLKKFIDFPVKLYKGNKYFTPYIYEDEISNLMPGKNPAASYCDFKLFLAYREGKIVGRICAILNHFSNEKYHQKRIRFNRIDMIDDIEVTKALIKAVEDFGLQNGMTEIAGPLGYSDQDKEGLLTYGFEEHNMFATFYHFPYYYEHLKQLGFIEDAKWNEYRVFIPDKPDLKLQKIADYTAKKYDFHIVQFKRKSKKAVKPYIVEVLSLVNRAYANLYGYVPIDEGQMYHLADQYIPLINLDYMQIVVDSNNKVVAFGLMIPTPVFALKRHKGHLFPLGWISFLRAIKKEKILDMLLVATEPELKNSGVMTMVFAAAINNAVRNKVKYCETGPELVTNEEVQSLWSRFEHVRHKTRACFVKPIENNEK